MPCRSEEELDLTAPEKSGNYDRLPGPRAIRCAQFSTARKPSSSTDNSRHICSSVWRSCTPASHKPTLIF